MSKPITLSPAETADLIAELRIWCRDELDMDLGNLPAERLLDFVRERIGPAFYNRGLYDAQAVVAARAEDIGEAVLALEKQRR